jgi:hypothetical protein
VACPVLQAANVLPVIREIQPQTSASLNVMLPTILLWKLERAGRPQSERSLGEAIGMAGQTR